MNDNVEIIRSNKGGLKLIHRGYMYTVHKKRQGGGIRWRCTQRSWHCKGSISTGNGPPTVNMPHNHIPDPHSVALARCRQIQEFPDLTSMLETEYDETRDTMPLQQKMLINSPQVQIPLSSPLQTQPLSPTKLKVSRSKPATSKTGSEFFSTLPPEEVCLRWNSHHSNMQNCFPRLLDKEQYVDVTLIAEGKSLKCHRMILSSCSTYFEEILGDIMPLQHPVIILKSTPFWILRALIDFMYAGEVNIDQNMLPELLDTAELLKIKGLAGKSAEPEQVIKQEVLDKADAPSKNEDVHINDPLELLQPKFNEDNALLKNGKDKMFPRKILTKKIRKRKSSEDECTSPPLFPMRRGTRSRPNVKVPRYYDYEDIVKPTSSDQPLSPGVTIKSEPPDVDDNDSQPSFTNAKNCTMEPSKTKAEISRVIKEKPPKDETEMKPEQLYKIKIKCLASMSEKPVQEQLPTTQLDDDKAKAETSKDESDSKKRDILNALEIIKIDVNVNKDQSVEEPKNNTPQIEIIAAEKTLMESEQNLEMK